MNDSRGLLKHHLRWGLALGGAVVLAIQTLTWVGLGLTNWTWISTYVLVAVIASLAARSLSLRVGGRPRFPRTVLLIVVMVLVGEVIYQTYMWVYINYVDPTWVETVAEVWTAQLREAGTAEDEIARNIADFRRQWETWYVFTVGLVRYALAQVILGLVAGTITGFVVGRRLRSEASRAG